MKIFLDTNILVYAVDERDPRKHEVARKCMRSIEENAAIVVSTQVLMELHSVLTSKLRMDPAQSRALVQATSLRYEVVTLTVDLIIRGLDVHIINKLSHWDACIISAAAASGCKEILTEDLQDGVMIEGVKIRNPFKQN